MRVVVTDLLGHAAYATFATQLRLDTVPPAEQPATTLYQPNKGLAINWLAADVPTVGKASWPCMARRRAWM